MEKVAGMQLESFEKDLAYPRMKRSSFDMEKLNLLPQITLIEEVAQESLLGQAVESGLQKNT